MTRPNRFLIARTKFADANVSSLVSSKEIQGAVESYFRPYQLKMWEKIVESYESNDPAFYKELYKSGTGTGKTEVFKFIPPYFMARRKEDGNNRGMVFGLVCHRICLIQDLGNRVLPIMTNKFRTDDSGYGKIWFDEKNPAGCGLPKDKIKYYIVNSGDKHAIDSLKDAKHVKNYTAKELEAEIEKNCQEGIHSMFICLYQSLGVYSNTIMKNIKFDLLICDEIHELNMMGQETFFKCCEVFKKTERCFYFSATIQLDKRDPRLKQLFEHN